MVLHFPPRGSAKFKVRNLTEIISQGAHHHSRHELETGRAIFEIDKNLETLSFKS